MQLALCERESLVLGVDGRSARRRRAHPQAEHDALFGRHRSSIIFTRGGIGVERTAYGLPMLFRASVHAQAP
jgi:hypothetical protein